MLLASTVQEALERALEQHGYSVLGFGVFLQNFGLPVPAESLVLSAAALARLGRLAIALVYLVAVVAAWTGDNIAFLLGRQLGRDVLTHRFSLLLTPSRIQWLDNFFGRWGARAIFVIRFIPGISMVSAVLAGSSDLPWRRYLLGEIPGVLAWVAVSCALGFYGSELGDRLRPYWAGVHHATWIALGAALAIALVMKVVRKRQVPQAGSD